MRSAVLSAPAVARTCTVPSKSAVVLLAGSAAFCPARQGLQAAAPGSAANLPSGRRQTVHTRLANADKRTNVSETLLKASAGVFRT